MAIKTEEKSWHDATGVKSNFEKLYFPGDREWVDCEVELKGRNGHQKFVVDIMGGGKHLQSKTVYVEKGKSVTLKQLIGKQCAVSVGGSLERDGVFSSPDGDVIVRCTYDDSKTILKSEKISWGDKTGGASCIENLFLEAKHYWQHAEILIENHPNQHSGAQVTLLANGEIVHEAPWTKIDGSRQVEFSVPVNQQAPLVVVGYITNHDKVFGGGAKITLTGFYAEGK